MLDKVLYEDKQELIPKLLTLNEDMLRAFESFKKIAESQDQKFNYHFAIENETNIINIRHDFDSSIALYRSAAVEEAKQY